MNTVRHYRIGEIAKQSGLSVEALRYYEKRGLLSPVSRSDSGYRLYSPNSLQRIQFIQRCKDLGFSLEEILDLLNLQLDPSTSSAVVKQRVEEKIALVEDKMHHLQQLKNSLTQLNEMCCGEGSVSECPIIEYLNQ